VPKKRKEKKMVKRLLKQVTQKKATMRQARTDLSQLTKAENIILKVIDKITKNVDFDEIIFDVGRDIYECKNDEVSKPNQKSPFAKFVANKKKEQQNQLLISELRKVIDIFNEHRNSWYRSTSSDQQLIKKLTDLKYTIKERKVIDTSAASNCLRAHNMGTSKRNSILEELYKDSKKTRSQFVEEMREIARKHSNANASIARVIKFEQYLKNKEVPFSYSGIIWVDECNDSDSNNDLPDSTTTEQVEGVVFAHNKQMAFNAIEEKYFNANTYEDDFLIEEISVKQAKQKAVA